MKTPLLRIDDLTATAITGDRIDLAWQLAPGCETYHIGRAGSPGQTSAITREPRLAVRELAPGTRYTFVVSGRDGQGAERARGEVTATTLPAGLWVSTDGPRLTVHGDACEVTWDGDAGGEIAEVRQYDGEGWFRINAANGSAVPGLVLTDESGRECPVRAQRGVAFRMEKETPEHVQFAVSVQAAGIRIGVRYIVFREGLLFGELTLPESDLVDGRTQGVDSEANKAMLDRVSGRLAFHLAPTVLDGPFAWGYIPRQTGTAQVMLRRSDRVEDARQMLPLAMIDYGRRAGGGFTNHVECFIEDSPSDGAATWFGDDGNGGFKLEWSFTGKSLRETSFLPWDMGFFRTRWGLCLGAMRKGRFGRALPARVNNLTAARILHAGIPQGVGPDLQDRWPYNVPPVNLIRDPYPGLPSDAAIEAARDQGVSVMVLHQGWMRFGGSNCDPPADYIPRDPADLKRFVETCHRCGIRVGLYMRGAEPYALYQPYFEQYLKRNFDGLYVDWCSPFSPGRLGCNPLHVSAFSFVLFTRALRARVGERGFLIAHSGGAPALLAFAMFDAYLPGEAKVQKESLLKSPDDSLYHGFASCMGTHPIPRFDLPQAIAYYAGLGFQPHQMWSPVRDPEGRNRPLRALWRMLASVPVEDAVCYHDRKERLAVVQATHPAFASTLYKVNADLALLMTANLGDEADTRVSLRLDLPALGLAGTYRIKELRAGPDGACLAHDLGTTSDGVIAPEPFAPWEYRGYRLERAG